MQVNLVEKAFGIILRGPARTGGVYHVSRIYLGTFDNIRFKCGVVKKNTRGMVRVSDSYMKGCFDQYVPSSLLFHIMSRNSRQQEAVA